jgi:hypothetical protein
MRGTVWKEAEGKRGVAAFICRRRGHPPCSHAHPNRRCSRIPCRIAGGRNRVRGASTLCRPPCGAILLTSRRRRATWRVARTALPRPNGPSQPPPRCGPRKPAGLSSSVSAGCCVLARAQLAPVEDGVRHTLRQIPSSILSVPPGSRSARAKKRALRGRRRCR